MMKPGTNRTALSMLVGIWIGGGAAVVLFATTGQAIYLGLAGSGAVIGLILGAGLDRPSNRRNAPPQP